MAFGFLGCPCLSWELGYSNKLGEVRRGRSVGSTRDKVGGEAVAGVLLQGKRLGGWT